ncbi:MAG: DUF4468 domain-containing protein [Bacteroidetes bacterium]|nr:DUF4468 domain-containing protein [Bacteroidota bacterium]
MKKTLSLFAILFLILQLQAQSDTIFTVKGDTISSVKITKVTPSALWYTQKNVGKSIPSANVKRSTFTPPSDTPKTDFVKELPVNPSTHLVTFSDTVIFKSSNKNKIYSKCKEWIATTWKSANDVIQMDDKESGVIIIKGWDNVYVTTTAKLIPETQYKMWFTIKLTIRDNFVKMDVFDIFLESYPNPNQYNGYSSETTKAYAEFFNVLDTSGKYYSERTNTIKFDARRQITNEANSTILSLTSALKDLDSQENVMTSDEALTELKRCKDKLDLGLITQEEYDKKKAELGKFIK